MNLDKTITNIGDLFFEFQAKIQFFEREYLRKFGIEDLTPNEVKVLYIIGISNTKSMSEIADELKITRGTLSITVNTLVKKGYIIRTRNKQDRRIIILYLTKRSIGIVKHYAKFYEALLISLTKNMEIAKVKVLEAMLSKLNEIVETNFYDNVGEYKIEEESQIHEDEVDQENMNYEEEYE